MPVYPVNRYQYDVFVPTDNAVCTANRSSDGIGQWMASIGLEPGYLMALLAGSTEFFGGLALVLGLLVRPAAVVLAFTMLVAIVAVHLGNSLFMANHGYEFGLALLAVAASLAITGGGRGSVDAVLARNVAAH
jgi:putative oxidoreductase